MTYDMIPILRQTFKRMKGLSLSTHDMVNRTLDSLPSLKYVSRGPKRTSLIAFILYYSMIQCNENVNPVDLLEIANVKSVHRLNTLFQYWSAETGLNVSPHSQDHITAIGSNLGIDKDTLEVINLNCQFLKALDTTNRVRNIGPLSMAAAMIGYWCKTNSTSITIDDIAVVSGVSRSTIVANIRKIRKVIES